MTNVSLHLGDCLAILKTLDAGSVDAVVTDPPYGLSFMGKNWDHGVPGVAFWEAALRVAKPGAHLLAFGGTRTFHRLTVAIEDAGWEIRDTLMWLYGSGFPKSLDIGKAIDKAAGAEREVIGESHVLQTHNRGAQGGVQGWQRPCDTDGVEWHRKAITAPATPAAQQWDGWGTALKPAWEPVIMARKPFDGTVAANVLQWGVGGLNVDASKIGSNGSEPNARQAKTKPQEYNGNTYQPITRNGDGWNGVQGRWPANLLLDEEAARLLDEQSGERKSSVYGSFAPKPDHIGGYGDAGGASRFFYVAKASKRDRDEGLEGMELQRVGAMDGNSGRSGARVAGDGVTPVQPVYGRNVHPTVKPTQLMRYLCRLVTPAGGVVLDPFMGSGSTGKAAMLEGFSFVGIEIDAEYLEIARRRIAEAQMQLPLLEVA